MAILAALGATLGATACQEAPSYRLSWELEGYREVSAATCAESGVLSVRVRAYALPTLDAPNLEELIRDELLLPCQRATLDDEGNVVGATLPPGDYAIQVRGVDRTSTPWIEGSADRITIDARGEDNGCGGSGTQECGPGAPFCVVASGLRCHDGSLGDPCDDDTQCQAPYACNGDNACEYLTGCDPETDYGSCMGDQLVCACQRLTITAKDQPGPGSGGDAVAVEEGSTAELPPFGLVPPPECNDGIDNDHDGLVDGLDPACAVSFGDGTEGLPVGITELRLDVTLFGGTAPCSAVPLTRIRLDWHGEGDGEGETSEETILEDSCQLERPYTVSLRLPAGPATFSVVGLDRDGLVVTTTKSFGNEISPTGGTVNAAIDFGANDFLEPIVSEIRARPVYVSQLGLEALDRSSCDPPQKNGAPYGGLLQLEQLRLELLNGHGGPLGAPISLEGGEVIDGPTALDCRTELVTEDLVWGSYLMVIEALSAEGEVCFSNAQDPFFAAPGNVQPILSRVHLDDGTVPDSCHDCETDADCGDEERLRCVANVCQSTCETDDDCTSDLLGELGFACVEGFCAWASDG
ncbi:hypothetical protein [Paraliomyxa miuraensis]|uniref:hypothetical protein n=1 Tax=Paraliomyxa miuraensis TaxID=376150 RepID=UPI00225353E4|nr:hypothetical protein [Paraliomyxa miuraensis]MCX4247660.1 hypothetical protein [Paraliomyxa miuraensis]